MELHSIVCTDSVETAFQEMQDQEPQRLTYINVWSAPCATLVEPLTLAGLRPLPKGSIKCTSLGS